ncbi:hypothetical protein [Microbacterium terricola]|nr:hypothetical protein [Microbacterium terricola]UYK41009.1 hypothetical protein OAU46_05020 [Microbacterium terricola]
MTGAAPSGIEGARLRRVPLIADTWPITIGDLVELAAGQVAEPTDRLETLYARRYDQLIVRARAVAGFGAGLLTALLVAVIVPAADDLIDLLLVIPALIVSALVVGVGVLLHVAAARVQREYIVAHAILGDLLAIGPLPRGSASP